MPSIVKLTAEDSLPLNGKTSCKTKGYSRTWKKDSEFRHIEILRQDLDREELLLAN
jgi:hypothetical protein